jgi:hypothetical protein
VAYIQANLSQTALKVSKTKTKQMAAYYYDIWNESTY